MRENTPLIQYADHHSNHVVTHGTYRQIYLVGGLPLFFNQRTTQKQESSGPTPPQRLPAVMQMRRRRWLLTLARFMARPREYEKRREASIRGFTPQKFRQEWELFWELFDPISDAFDTKVRVRFFGRGGWVYL